MTGTLYLCPTPIGNLEDISLRVLNVLRSADLIAAEDTRHTIKLLNHFDIRTPMTSYHEYNRVEKAKQLVDKLLLGTSIALVSDAGTPGISDPGEELVRFALEAGVPVTSLPGPCACITALTMSGLPTRRFCFEGFLPEDKKEVRTVLERLERETRTTVLYEAPHRLLKTLERLSPVIGDRRIAFCRELTKAWEQRLEMTCAEALAYYAKEPPRGEFVLVIEGADETEMAQTDRDSWLAMSVTDHVAMYLKQGMDKKTAMKAAAADRGVTRREIYTALLEEETDG